MHYACGFISALGGHEHFATNGGVVTLGVGVIGFTVSVQFVDFFFDEVAEYRERRMSLRVSIHIFLSDFSPLSEEIFGEFSSDRIQA